MGTQWKSMRGSLSLVSKDGPKHANLSNLSMDYDIESLKGYCYHCGKLVPKPSIRNYTDNNTIPAGDVDAVELILYRFQLDISFNATLRNMSNENTTFSADVWECVEFFTIPIWMGLLSSLILMMVLFYGITMISNITTMDRFDDPKGKTITVTVNE
ncbi:hypothetical protein DPMN_004054 [Dreissena polymorpha]|uniref:V-type proton ATPase subunit S1/VOA1 transmembrane domain-containing protein n=2 Tax=Dreissena polymorpha TaxID=45954 RepID=A0A9D4RSM6_DREPO|nr:hypothetical protein DPMN_004054 [Dreissena polymorpha]